MVIVGSAIQLIAASAARERVVAGITGQSIAALAADQQVATVAADQAVSAFFAAQSVVAVLAVHEVVAGARADVVVTAAGHDAVCTASRADTVVATAGSNRVGSRATGDRHRQCDGFFHSGHIVAIPQLDGDAADIGQREGTRCSVERGDDVGPVQRHTDGVCEVVAADEEFRAVQRDPGLVVIRDRDGS